LYRLFLDLRILITALTTSNFWSLYRLALDLRPLITPLVAFALFLSQPPTTVNDDRSGRDTTTENEMAQIFAQLANAEVIIE
jgi:hypothetical protein